LDGDRPRLEEPPLADAERGRPEHRAGEPEPGGERDEHDEREARPAGLVLEVERERARVQRVDERPRAQHHERGGARPCRQPPHSPTFSVYGAVTTLPPSGWNWRNSLHVPATGTSTPTCSFPGVADVPVTLDPPSTLAQPVAPGAHTCVWK